MADFNKYYYISENYKIIFEYFLIIVQIIFYNSEGGNKK